jgi:hypothetical protein
MHEIVSVVDTLTETTSYLVNDRRDPMTSDVNKLSVREIGNALSAQ